MDSPDRRSRRRCRAPAGCSGPRRPALGVPCPWSTGPLRRPGVLRRATAIPPLSQYLSNGELHRPGGVGECTPSAGAAENLALGQVAPTARFIVYPVPPRPLDRVWVAVRRHRRSPGPVRGRLDDLSVLYDGLGPVPDEQAAAAQPAPTQRGRRVAADSTAASAVPALRRRPGPAPSRTSRPAVDRHPLATMGQSIWLPRRHEDAGAGVTSARTGSGGPTAVTDARRSEVPRIVVPSKRAGPGVHPDAVWAVRHGAVHESGGGGVGDLDAGVAGTDERTRRRPARPSEMCADCTVAPVNVESVNVVSPFRGCRGRRWRCRSRQRAILAPPCCSITTAGLPAPRSRTFHHTSACPLTHIPLPPPPQQHRPQSERPGSLTTTAEEATS